MRENYQRKGARYPTEARLNVERVDRSGIRATCRGSGAIYELGSENGRWHCSCPAVGRCAHLVALMLVCVREASA